MSYLKEIIADKGITEKQLSEMSGVTHPTLWRLCNTDSFQYARKETQIKIANALNVTVREIIEGEEIMKKKVIETEVTKAAEHLSSVLRKYYKNPMHLHMTIFTRDAVGLRGETENKPDYYDVRVGDGADLEDRIVDKSALIAYGPDENGIEKIVNTIPYYKRGVQNE